MVPSLEPATAPVAVEFGEDGLVTEEAVEGGAFKAVDPEADGLRTIRALGGMASVVREVTEERTSSLEGPVLLTRFPLFPSSLPDAHSAARWT
jgi:hypothetical protein